MNHHSMKHAILVINNLLKNLKYQIFAHVAADHVTRGVGAAVLMEEYMDASNFGVGNIPGLFVAVVVVVVVVAAVAVLHNYIQDNRCQRVNKYTKIMC